MSAFGNPSWAGAPASAPSNPFAAALTPPTQANGAGGSGSTVFGAGTSTAKLGSGSGSTVFGSAAPKASAFASNTGPPNPFAQAFPGDGAKAANPSTQNGPSAPRNPFLASLQSASDASQIDSGGPAVSSLFGSSSASQATPFASASAPSASTPFSSTPFASTSSPSNSQASHSSPKPPFAKPSPFATASASFPQASAGFAVSNTAVEPSADDSDTTNSHRKALPSAKEFMAQKEAARQSSPSLSSNQQPASHPSSSLNRSHLTEPSVQHQSRLQHQATFPTDAPPRQSSNAKKKSPAPYGTIAPRDHGFRHGDAEPMNTRNPYAQRIYQQLRKDGIAPPTWPADPGNPMNKGAMSQFREAYKTYRERARASLVRAGLVDDPDARRRLEDAIDFKGVCEDMCPEFEKVTRITELDVKHAEKDPRSLWASTQLMVKKLARSAAGQEAPLPMDVRSMAALRRTLDYLVDGLLRSDDRVSVMHGFLWDRTRAIRRDFAFFSSMTAEELRDQAYCLETIVRFHVTSLHLLARPEHSYEEYSEQQEVEQLSKALLSLMYTYDDCDAQAVACPQEAEFRAYYILFRAFDPNILELVQCEWDGRMWRDSDVVRTAVAMVEALQNTRTVHGPLQPGPTMATAAGYASYFGMVADAKVSYTMACFAEIHFGALRRSILRALNAGLARPRGAARDVTASVVNSFLRFDTVAEAVAFVEMHGLSFDRAGADGFGVFVAKYGPSALTNPRLHHSFSQTLVEVKRGRHSLPEVIHTTVFADATDHANHATITQQQQQQQQQTNFDPSDSLFVSNDAAALRSTPANTSMKMNTTTAMKPVSGMQSNATSANMGWNTSSSSSTGNHAGHANAGHTGNNNTGANSVPSKHVHFSDTVHVTHATNPTTAASGTTASGTNATGSATGSATASPTGSSTLSTTNSRGLFSAESLGRPGSGQAGPMNGLASTSPTLGSGTGLGGMTAGDSGQSGAESSSSGMAGFLHSGNAGGVFGGGGMSSTLKTNPFSSVTSAPASDPKGSVSSPASGAGFFSQPAPPSQQSLQPSQQSSQPQSQPQSQPPLSSLSPSSQSSQTKPSLFSSIHSSAPTSTSTTTLTSSTLPSSDANTNHANPAPLSAPKAPSSPPSQPSSRLSSTAPPLPSGTDASNDLTNKPDTLSTRPSTQPQNAQPQNVQPQNAQPQSPGPLLRFTEWFVLGDGGLLSQFEAYLVEQITGDAWTRHHRREAKRKRRDERRQREAEARAFREYTLAKRYVARWRESVHAKRLTTLRKRGREQLRAAHQQQRHQDKRRKHTDHDHDRDRDDNGNGDAVAEFHRRPRHNTQWSRSQRTQNTTTRSRRPSLSSLVGGYDAILPTREEPLPPPPRSQSLAHFPPPPPPPPQEYSSLGVPIMSASPGSHHHHHHHHHGNARSTSPPSSLYSHASSTGSQGGSKTRALREQFARPSSASLPAWHLPPRRTSPSHRPSSSSFRHRALSSTTTSSHGSTFARSQFSPSPSLSRLSRSGHAPRDANRSRVSKVSHRWKLKALGLETMPNGQVLPDSLALPMKYEGERYEGVGACGLDEDTPETASSRRDGGLLDPGRDDDDDDRASSPGGDDRFGSSVVGTVNQSTVDRNHGLAIRDLGASVDVDDDDDEDRRRRRLLRPAHSTVDTHTLLAEMRRLREDMEESVGWFREQNDRIQQELVTE